QAFIGTDHNPGLRVTFDTSLSFQGHRLYLHEEPSGLPILPANSAIMEIKVNERIPIWLTELIAAHNLQLVGFSKYCRSVQAAQRIPAARGHGLVAEYAQDVLSSSLAAFSTLEQIMGIHREQETDRMEATRGRDFQRH
ncbi:MAG: VTC domain-containing protein, partial [Anaerolineae bacterium]